MSLVLSRKALEKGCGRKKRRGSRPTFSPEKLAAGSIIIGGIITVTVLNAEGGRARLMIDAPPDVPVLRGDATKTTPQETPVP